MDTRNDQRATLTAFNPFWVRELWIQGRSQRLPLALAALTIVVAILVCAIGAVASLRQEPARVGALLYQVFFGTAFAWVTWLGAGIAATSIAAERARAGWDVLLVSGVSTASIARGSFLASLTWVLLGLAMLSPIASLSFLFGGVSAGEIGGAFVALAAAGCLAVGFGTTVGSAAATSNGALLVSLPLCALASVICYGLGFLSSYFASVLWPAVPEGMALWWPTALSRAAIDANYWWLLVVTPVVAFSLCAWFFYEITLTLLAEPNTDRSTRLRYWFILCGLILCGASMALLTAFSTDRVTGYAVTLIVMAAFSLFGLYTLAGDDLGPSPRVLANWSQTKTNTWHRFCGPGVVRAMLTLCMLAALGIGTQWLMALRTELHAPSETSAFDLTVLSVCDGYTLAFICFLAGFVAYTRARSRSGSTPRLLLTFVLLAITIGPWILASVFGMVDAFGLGSALLIASPSPVFVVALALIAPENGNLPGSLLLAGLVASTCWLCAGLALLYAAQRRIDRGERAVERTRTTSIAQ
jgi:hypothetical protein